MFLIRIAHNKIPSQNKQGLSSVIIIVLKMAAIFYERDTCFTGPVSDRCIPYRSVT